MRQIAEKWENNCSLGEMRVKKKIDPREHFYASIPCKPPCRKQNVKVHWWGQRASKVISRNSANKVRVVKGCHRQSVPHSQPSSSLPTWRLTKINQYIWIHLLYPSIHSSQFSSFPPFLLLLAQFSYLSLYWPLNY